jgi:hypothetical protein
MRLFGKIAELIQIILRTSADNKTVSVQAPASLTHATENIFTTPDLQTGSIDTLVSEAMPQTITDKTLGTGTTIIQPTLSIQDTDMIIQDEGDNTSQLQFELTDLPTSTTITIRPPLTDDTLVGKATVDQLSNKTYTEPEIVDFAQMVETTTGAVPNPPDASRQRLFVDAPDGMLKRKDSTGTVYNVEGSGSPDASTVLSGLVNVVDQEMGGNKTFTKVSSAANLFVNTNIAADARFQVGQSNTPLFSFGWDSDQARFQMNTGSFLSFGQGIAITSGQLLSQSGVDTAPSIAFSIDPDTGFFWDTHGRVNWSGNASQGGYLDNQGIKVTVSGSAGSPPISFMDDTDTGLYQYTTDEMAWTGGGTPGGILHGGGIRVINGAQGTPSISSVLNEDQGFYFSNEAVNATVSGVFQGGFTTRGLRIKDGNVGSPSLYFSDDVDTGMYRTAGGDFSFSSNGVQTVRIANKFMSVGTTSGTSATFRILTNNVSTGSLEFGDNNAGDAGEMRYDHNSNRFSFKSAGSDNILATNSRWRGSSGNNTSPGLSFVNDTNTGFYSSSDGVIAWAGNGSTGGYLDQNGITFISNGSASTPSIRWLNDSNTGFYYTESLGNEKINIAVNGARKFTFSDSSLHPGDNSIDIGGNPSPERFNQIYCATIHAFTSNISDRRLKEEIKDATVGLDFLKLLRPVSYKYLEKDDEHQGFIAQEYKEALDLAGIDSEKHAAYRVAGEEDAGDVPNQLSLGYIELIAPLVKAVQELATRVEELENS